MRLIDFIGYLAAIMTTTAFAPQAVLTWKTRRVDGISLGMYCILTAGVLLWLVYGVMMEAWPLIVANGATLVLAGFILSMKVRYALKKPPA